MAQFGYNVFCKHATCNNGDEGLGESDDKKCSHLVKFLSFQPYFLGIKVRGKHSRLKFGKILPLRKNVGHNPSKANMV
jgi:hypothetical protein